MILGRNPALWLALITAALNALVIVFGVSLSGEQMAALNGLAIAIIGVVANEADPTTLPTLARSTTAPTMPAAPLTSETASSSGAKTSTTPIAGGDETTTERPASWPPQF
jgi:fructose-specific component phosphotransferase system IIB-like protein